MGAVQACQLNLITFRPGSCKPGAQLRAVSYIMLLGLDRDSRAQKSKCKKGTLASVNYRCTPKSGTKEWVLNP